MPQHQFSECSGDAQHAALQLTLQQHFKLTSFRHAQLDIIKSVLAGRDTLAIMPTGGGKSLCFQLPAFTLPGLTIVVSPLISLMQDQVIGLENRGLAGAAIHSNLKKSELTEIERKLLNHEYKILYVAPERFDNADFMAMIKSLQISLFVVDEAHVVSMWGHDFRPDYAKLGKVLTSLGRPTTIALTATATPMVQSDIIKVLGMLEPQVFISGFARPNLHISRAFASSPQSKWQMAAETMSALKTGIIYCSTRKGVDEIQPMLEHSGYRAMTYHAGMSRENRSECLRAFQAHEIDVVAATNAFGMGIDRADLRFVIHWDVPGSLEAYYQEIGRAGRDGNDSQAIIFDDGDYALHRWFIENANPLPIELQAVYWAVQNRLQQTTGRDHLEMTIEAITDWTKAKILDSRSPQLIGLRRGMNSIKVGTALKVLSLAGHISRFEIKGSRTKGTKLSDPKKRASELKFDEAKLQQKRDYDFARLQTMQSYLRTTNCRQFEILEYFGDLGSLPCGKCDNCKRPK